MQRWSQCQVPDTADSRPKTRQSRREKQHNVPRGTCSNLPVRPPANAHPLQDDTGDKHGVLIRTLRGSGREHHHPRGAQRGGLFSAARSLTHTSNDIGRVTNAHRTIQHHTRAGQPACTTCTGDRRGVRLRREHDDGTRQSDRDRTDSDHSHTDAALLLAGKRGCDPLGRAGLEQLCSRHACWASVENRLSVERGVGTYQRKTA